MNKEIVEKYCKEKETQLLERYFGNLVKEAALEQPETIGEYTKDLPLKMNIVLILKVCGKNVHHR